MPFAPPADGAQVDVVDIGMAVISLAQPLDEVEMGLQDGGVVHIGDGVRALPLVVGLKFLAAPFRMIGLAFGGRAAHDPEGQLLPRVVGFLQHLVQESRIELPRLRLQFRPSPAGILDRGGDPLGQAFVLFAGLVESLPSDARVGEDFVCFFGLDDDLIFGKETCSPGQKSANGGDSHGRLEHRIIPSLEGQAGHAFRPEGRGSCRRQSSLLFPSRSSNRPVH